jgi:hypothetical protein
MTKKELTEKCRAIASAYDFNEVINNQEHFEFLLNLFSCHTEWELKKGCGIKSIAIKKDMYGKKYFFLNRIDGSGTDISYVHCISARTPLMQIKMACRYAIRSIIQKYKEENVQYNVSTCPITGEILTRDNTHIDHYDLSFQQMFELWMQDKCIDDLYRKINRHEDKCLITLFTCTDTNSDFVEFHNKHCKLRAVTKTANLSILRS